MIRSTDTHLCNVPRCTQEIGAKFLMCRAHWAMVPGHLQSLVWHNYRRGQEHDGKPSRAYVTAAREAIDAVMEKLRAEAEQADMFDGNAPRLAIFSCPRCSSPVEHEREVCADCRSRENQETPE